MIHSTGTSPRAAVIVNTVCGFSPAHNTFCRTVQVPILSHYTGGSVWHAQCHRRLEHQLLGEPSQHQPHRWGVQHCTAVCAHEVPLGLLQKCQQSSVWRVPAIDQPVPWPGPLLPGPCRDRRLLQSVSPSGFTLHEALLHAVTSCCKFSSVSGVCLTQSSYVNTGACQSIQATCWISLCQNLTPHRLSWQIQLLPSTNTSIHPPNGCSATLLISRRGL